MPIDKVTLQILANHCAAATESMAYTLFRTAHSTFVKETEDFTTGLATPKGLTFASPKDLGATWFVGLDYGDAIKMVDNYRPGDLCMTNDPYSGYACTHSPDIHLWKPIFWKDELVCYSVGHIHNTDVGGAVPASLSRTLVEVHQEGIRVPPSKLYSEGKLNDELLRVMMTNVRVPDQNWGDLKAQIAGMNTGERKVHEMIERFGIDTFREGINDLLDYSEQQTRNLIRTIPDGDYFFADYMDEDAAGGVPCRIAITLKVKGDELVLDYTGSDPQLTSSLNMPTGGKERHILPMVGLVYVFYTLDPTILLNSGMMRPARAILPEGTVVNPKFPAAVGMRSLTCMRVQDTTFGCFARALPDRMPACPSGGGPMMNVKTTDNRTGRVVMASIDPVLGGAGGSPHADGSDGSGANSSFLKNTPVEINEVEVPIKILRYGLAQDSGGAGKHRGGLASSLEFKVFAPNTTITARNRDRSHFAAWGAAGGKASATSFFHLNPGTNHEVNLANTDIFTVEPGDVIRMTCSGAGGWGDPLERPADAVLHDVRCHFVSTAAALRDYGVVIVDGKIDARQTESRRAAMRREAKPADQRSFFDYGPERSGFETVWTLGNYDALTAILKTLPVNWRFFVKRKIFDAIERTPSAERRGDGSEVRRVFDRILKEYPQLQPQAAE
jgi:N-methylhydantoinase B